MGCGASRPPAAVSPTRQGGLATTGVLPDGEPTKHFPKEIKEDSDRNSSSPLVKQRSIERLRNEAASAAATVKATGSGSSDDANSKATLERLAALSAETLAEEFARADTDGTRKLSCSELSTLLVRLFGDEVLSAVDATGRRVVDSLLAALDTDGSGDVDLDELQAAWRAWFGQALNPKRCLIIVDVQNDFIDGTLGLKGCPAGQVRALLPIAGFLHLLFTAAPPPPPPPRLVFLVPFPLLPAPPCSTLLLLAPPCSSLLPTLSSIPGFVCLWRPPFLTRASSPLLARAASQDGAAVVPVINKMRAAHPWDSIIISMDWHPEGHCSFFEVVTAGNSPVPLHPSQDPEEAKHASVFSTVTLVAPDGTSAMRQTLWPQHCVQDTWGSQNHADLDVTESDIIVQKGTNPGVDSYSAFYDNQKLNQTSLLGKLRELGMTHVFVTGLALDVCVAFTALHAAEEGFVTYVVSDACAGVTHEGIAEKKRAFDEVR